MSDFLARLVARSRADGRSEIRPRVPSMFAPGLTVAQENAPAADEDARMAESVAARRPPPHHQDTPTVHRGLLVGEEVARSPEGGESQRGAEPVVQPVSLPGLPPRDGEPSLRIGPHRKLVPNALAMNARPQRERLRGSPPVAPLPKPQVARGARANGSGDGDDPPVIRVTIGRIDVRAITEAPPAAPARKPAAPGLPLDEYLRQRTRGER